MSASFIVSGDAAYTYTQGLPSALWTVSHNLGKRPSVTVVDSAGSAVIGDVTYLDDNILTVAFESSFAGEAYLN